MLVEDVSLASEAMIATKRLQRLQVTVKALVLVAGEVGLVRI